MKLGKRRFMKAAALAEGSRPKIRLAAVLNTNKVADAKASLVVETGTMADPVAESVLDGAGADMP